MKSINYFSFLVFIIIASPIKAQYDTDEPIDSGLPVISDCGFNGDVDGSQVADLPIVTFNINIHFIGSANGNFSPTAPGMKNGAVAAAKFIKHFNDVMSGLVPSPTGIYHFTGDSRMRVNLYSDQTEEPDDLYSGVWYYDSDRTTLDNVRDYTEIDRLPYGDKVLHIIIRDKLNDDICAGSGIGGNPTFMYNYWAGVLADLGESSDPDCNRPALNLDYGNILTHEIGHNFGLKHTWCCDQGCPDIDAEAECRGPGTCGNSGSCTGRNNPNECDQWGNYDITTSSSNIMDYNALHTSLSVCQWCTWYHNAAQLEGCDERMGYVSLSSDYAPLEVAGYHIQSGETVNIDQEIYSTDDILIEPGGKLIVNRVLKMGENKEIRVKPGGRVRINGTITSGSCQEEDVFWDGIVLEGDPNAIQFNGNQASVYISGGEISYAKLAIEARSGALVRAVNGHFLNNDHAVVFEAYHKTSLSFFSGCIFEVRGRPRNNKRAYPRGRNFTGFISAYFLSQLSIDNCTFNNANYNPAVFHDADNSAVGITTIDVNLQVNTCEFKNLTMGIMSFKFGYPRPIVVQSSSFQNCFYGIYSYAVDNAILTGNHIDSRPPIGAPYIVTSGLIALIPNPNAMPAGIAMYGGTGYTISENVIDGLLNLYTAGVGIWIAESGEEPNIAVKNEIIFRDYGIMTSGNNYNPFRTLRGLQLFCNSLEFNQNDIYVQSVTAGLDGIAEVQGSATSPAGNAFKSGTYGVNELDNEGDKIIYYYNTDSWQNLEFPDRVTNTDLEESSVSSNCGLGSDTPDEDPECCVKLTETQKDDFTQRFDSLQLIYESLESVYESYMGEAAQTTLLQDIENADEANATTIYQQLISAVPYLNETIIYAVADRPELFSHEQLKTILIRTPDEARKQILLDYLANTMNPLSPSDFEEIIDSSGIVSDRTELEKQMAELRLTQNIIANRMIVDLQLDTPTIQYETLRTWFLKKASSRASFSALETYLSEENYAAAQADLDDIMASWAGEVTIANSNHQILKELQIEGVMNNWNWEDLDTLVLQQLTDLAMSDQGPGSWQAQALLTVLYDENYLKFPIILENNAEKLTQDRIPPKSSSTLANAPTLTAIPNPAISEVRFEYRLTQAGELLVMDFSGQLIKRFVVDKNSHQQVWNLDQVPIGLYFYCLKDKNGYSSIQRLVVSR